MHATIVLSFFKTCLYNAQGFFYPNICILCSLPLQRDNRWFCPACIQQLENNNTQRTACPSCGINTRKGSCICTPDAAHSFSGMHALFDFDEQVQEIIHHIKYNSKKRLIRDMGIQYSPRIPPDFFTDIDGLVPVPLHFVREIKRGFNQSVCFAQGIVQGLNLQIPIYTRILTRKRYTTTQTKYGRKKRLENLRGAFTVHVKKRGIILNKKLIVIDDVVTTGATAEACSETLLENGAADVKILALGRA